MISPDAWQAIWLTIQLATLTTIILLVIATPFGLVAFADRLQVASPHSSLGDIAIGSATYRSWLLYSALAGATGLDWYVDSIFGYRFTVFLV